MPATERYQVDIFGIVVLIATVLVLVFLIIAAIYFFNLMNLKPPSRGESTFLFWTTVVLAIIFGIIVIYALIHIFTHKSVVYEEPKAVTKTIVTTPRVAVAAPVPTTITTTTASPVLISNIPQTSLPTNQSVAFSDIPVTQSQRTALNQELINLGSSISNA
ncbi:Hypothetical protein HVR_LOCUS1290 [uncultured virus]|nr:Hypothetical protein HVR_LOCUS1290 [uncultured virus]